MHLRKIADVGSANPFRELETALTGARLDNGGYPVLGPGGAELSRATMESVFGLGFGLNTARRFLWFPVFAAFRLLFGARLTALTRTDLCASVKLSMARNAMLTAFSE